MTCPHFGAQVQGNFCEYCGSELTKGATTIHITNNYYGAPQPQNPPAPARQRRKTWLWVLGWLFLFPLPLTILLLRKKDMKPWLKYGIIILAWALFLIIGTSGDSETQVPPAGAILNIVMAHL